VFCCSLDIDLDKNDDDLDKNNDDDDDDDDDNNDSGREATQSCVASPVLVKS